MNRKLPCYEDYFKISNSQNEQNVMDSESSLRQAATLLADQALGVVKTALGLHFRSEDTQTDNVMSEAPEQGNLFRERMPMDWQNEQHRSGGWNPNFDDRRHMRPTMVGEPHTHCERLRPLETCENYETSNWNLLENRREQGFFHDQEEHIRGERWETGRNDFPNEGQFEMQHTRGGQFVGNTDYERQPYYDRPPHYDRQPFYDSQPPQQRDRRREFHSDNYESHLQEFVGEHRNQDIREFRASTITSTSQQQKESIGFSNTRTQKMDQGESRQDDEDDDDEEDTSYCKLCDVHFDSAQKYFTHTRGLLHTQRQMAADNSNEGQAEEGVGLQRPEEWAGFQKPETQQQKKQTGPGKAQGDGIQQEEDDDDDDKDTSFCKLCSMHFDDPQKFHQHTRGMLHTQRQMAAEKSELGPMQNEGQQQQQEGQDHQQQPGSWQQFQVGKPASTQNRQEACATEGNEGEEQDDYWEEEWEEVQDKTPKELVCELCDIKTTGIQALRAHECGKAHKAVQEAIENGTPLPQRFYSKLGPKAKIPENLKPATAAVLGMKPVVGPSVLLDLMKNIPEAVVGTAHVKEGHSGKQPTFLCMICESMCDASGMLSHLIGSKHRMKYLREYHPTIYEHVRSHGGKKSQLSAFLEEVCSDIEKKEGRKEPVMDKPDGDTDDKREKDESAKNDDRKTSGDQKIVQKDEKADHQMPSQEKTKRNRRRSRKRHLPHDAVMEKYREERMRHESYGPEGPYGGRDLGEPVEPFRFGSGRYRYGPGFGPPPSDPEFDPFCNFPGRPGPYPPALDYPDPYMSEEERLRHMFDYENYLFNHPMLLVSPEEARRRMFDTYERLGIPYDIACDRIMIQEDKRAKIMEYMNEGLSLKDAQARLKRLESGMRLIREYEQQGLDPRAARWRAVVEEERSKLYEKYEQLGFTPAEARAKIMAGEERMHLIQEFERHGMTSEEAYKRAVNEEDRLKDFGKPSDREQSLDDIADRRMLETYVEQGDTREQAENKVIAVLRRQGVPTQEAILRVQKIDIKVSEKHDRRTPPRSQDDHKKGHDQKGKSSSKPAEAENFDNITPEEAKERLFKEYEKRGVPREKARIALIQELVRSGVPEEEAKRRFSDFRPTEMASKERRGKRKYTGYEHSRSRSPSSSSDSSCKRRRSKYSKSRQDDRARTDVHDDRYRFPEQRRREEKLSNRHEKDHDRGARSNKDGERHKEPQGRPTLTLGEELKLKVRKLKRDEFLSRLEERSSSTKQAKSGVSQSLAEKPQLWPKKDDKSVSNLLESLTDNLISSEGNESVALSMSKALTSALLKYRLNTTTDKKEKPSGSESQSSFVERRIQDAKKLFETKMQPPKDSSAPSGSGLNRGGYGLQLSSGGAGKQGVGGKGRLMDASRTVTPESFGLPPPLPVHVQQISLPSQPYTAQPSQSSVQSQPRLQTRASEERKPIVPRVLLAQKNPTRGSSSSTSWHLH